jgi:hypothetical protein
MPRPPARTGFNDETCRDVAYWMARGLTAQASAAKAGIARNGRFSDLLRTTAFADMLRDAINDHLAKDCAPEAVKVLRAILKDEKAPARVRVDACKTVLDRTGYNARDGSKIPGSDKDVAQMTQDELLAFIAAGEKELSARAHDVTPTAAEYEMEGAQP